VIINVAHKKCDVDVVGKQGTVLSVTHNGWIKVQVRHQQPAAVCVSATTVAYEQAWRQLTEVMHRLATNLDSTARCC
jgi:hypothetical protein